ncbi:hypothetical protein [Micromonospora sp. RP3T]|uniref:hypothetical protein n=1 Tax=Micromonospora sp. RP3T TaxID=2135446 RepID=UPI003D70C4A4
MKRAMTVAVALVLMGAVGVLAGRCSGDAVGAAPRGGDVRDVTGLLLGAVAVAFWFMWRRWRRPG